MKEQFNKIDELLKSGLEGFEQQPSPGVWRKIAAALFFAGNGFYFLIAAVLLISSGAIYYYTSHNNEIPASPQSASVENATTPVINEIQDSKFANVSTNPTIQIDDEKFQTESESQKGKNETTLEINSTQLEKKHAEKSEAPVETSPIVKENSPSNNLHFASTSSIYDYPGIEQLSENSEGIDITLQSKQLQYLPFMNSSKNQMNERFAYSNLKIRFDDDYGKPINLLLGLHAAPEFIFSEGDNKPSDPVWNFDLTAYYFKNDWFIQAGVGVGLARDNGTFNVYYAQYDSVGYYDAVQSFDIDLETGAPVFHTHQEALWDTVEYRQNKTTNNSYTYLRLPVYIGLQMYEMNRLSIYVKGGGIYSVMLKSNEPELEYANDNATWIKITDETRKRLSSNFQLSAGVALQYHLSNSISLTAEPLYNYYFNPVYRKDQESNAWSISFRTGIIFKISSK